MSTLSLGEGNTPLVESRAIGPALGIGRLRFKLENCNPSGSYKDRFAVAFATSMRDAGVRACVATSSGNTGAALAAYCARAGIGCILIVNDGAPAGKLLQIRAHGATVIRVKDFVVSPEVTQDTFAVLRALSKSEGIPLGVSAYSYCPEAMANVETIGRELTNQCGTELTDVFVPAGGGGLFTAVSRGLRGSGAKAHAVQPEGCSTIVGAHQAGERRGRTVTSTTRISGLSVPFDIDASEALEELYAQGGLAIPVSDEEVWAAQRTLLHLEGIYTEPAGATALAGACRAARDGRIGRGSEVVCLVTGSGFKDTDSLAGAAAPSPEFLLDPPALREQVLEITRAGLGA